MRGYGEYYLIEVFALTSRGDLPTTVMIIEGIDWPRATQRFPRQLTHDSFDNALHSVTHRGEQRLRWCARRVRSFRRQCSANQTSVAALRIDHLRKRGSSAQRRRVASINSGEQRIGKPFHDFGIEVSGHEAGNSFVVIGCKWLGRREILPQHPELRAPRKESRT